MFGFAVNIIVMKFWRKVFVVKGTFCENTAPLFKGIYGETRRTSGNHNCFIRDFTIFYALGKFRNNGK